MSDYIDGYSFEEIERFVFDSVVQARCPYCKHEMDVEPDAENYDCHGCGAKGVITSPLVKLGLI